eukprot:6077578-Prymnesium_polylepis.2
MPYGAPGAGWFFCKYLRMSFLFSAKICVKGGLHPIRCDLMSSHRTQWKPTKTQQRTCARGSHSGTRSTMPSPGAVASTLYGVSLRSRPWSCTIERHACGRR